MPRRPKIEPDESGGTVLRLRIPSRMWQMISQYADKLHVHPEVAARILLEQIDGLISTGETGWLSPDWRGAAKVAKPVQIDHARLHRSDRTKSGYAGVYANGNGFRATGRNGAYIGTFETADWAAWERYLHYTRQGLPYGELETAIDELRQQGVAGTDAELRSMIEGTDQKIGAGGGVQMAGFEDAQAAEAALREHDAQEERPRGTGRSLIRKDQA